MLDFFSSVIQFFSTILNLIVSLLQALWTFITTIALTLEFVIKAIGYLPSFVLTFALAIVSVSIVYVLINHGGS